MTGWRPFAVRLYDLHLVMERPMRARSFGIALLLVAGMCAVRAGAQQPAWAQAGVGLGESFGTRSYRTGFSALGYFDVGARLSSRLGAVLSTSYAVGVKTIVEVCPMPLGGECNLKPDVARFAGVAMLLSLSSRGDSSFPVWSAAVGAGVYGVSGSSQSELGLQGVAQRTFFSDAPVGIVVGLRTIVLPRTQGATQAALHLTLGVRR